MAGKADQALTGHAALSVWEPHIRALVTICPVSAESYSGPLNGVTVGVKDIIDVVGVPTRNGSATSGDANPASCDADVVAALRGAGADILGKTVTTEFAFTDPTDCRNPYDIERSPGGSSSGSGAAVAAGLVDIALGTQTAGSLIRPAAYCGVVGFKPTYGVLPTQGVTPLAPSFDSVGVIARTVDAAKATFVAINGHVSAQIGAPLRAARWLLPGDMRAEPDAHDALDAAEQALRLCCEMQEAPSASVDTTTIVAAHRTVMQAEAAEAHGHLLSGASAELLRPKFRAGLEAGALLEAAQVGAARLVLRSAAEEFWQSMDGVDVILTLPVPDGAPRLDGSTGFQDWLTPWTVFGGPLISLPWGLDRLGRPRAVMLAGKPGADVTLLDLAAELEQLAPATPAPEPPSA